MHDKYRPNLPPKSFRKGGKFSPGRKVSGRAESFRKGGKFPQGWKVSVGAKSYRLNNLFDLSHQGKQQINSSLCAPQIAIFFVTHSKDMKQRSKPKSHTRVRVKVANTHLYVARSTFYSITNITKTTVEFWLNTSSSSSMYA